MTRLRVIYSAFFAASTLSACWCGAHAQSPPEPPSNVIASDHPSDAGDQLDIQWTPSPDDGTSVAEYRLLWTYAPDSIADASKQAQHRIDRVQTLLAQDPQDPVLAELLRNAQAELQQVVAGSYHDADRANAGETSATLKGFDSDLNYIVAVRAIGKDGDASADALSAPVSPRKQWIDLSRIWLAGFALLLCGSIITFILLARGGMPMRVRRIAGLEAMEEAVGRATEMGRPVLYINGTQDMNDLMTVAGLTVLSKVARTVADYDATLEVPTSRSMVMTAARETVQSAFLAAGRPDAYNEDLIYYVTDEQFGFVAYLSGMMVRNKPAACFYMGAFFAESLILAETGNAVGAIQIAGTAEPAQLPFFVAACDYTLIGEEFFAASAYLSGEPNQLGSLRGQDLGKIIAAVTLVVGSGFATFVAVVGPGSVFAPALNYLMDTILK